MKKSTDDEHAHFASMLTNLKNVFTLDDGRDSTQKENKPLMSETELNELEGIEDKVDEILEKVN